MKRYTVAAILLLLLGLMQMSGDLLGLPALKGLGAASGASPAPKVFSTDGKTHFEMFSTQFDLKWADTTGNPQQLRITPTLYSRLQGPYNRRNAYGAVLAYGPILAASPHLEPLFTQIATYALCDDRPLLRELGVDPTTIKSPVDIEWTPRPGIPQPRHISLHHKVPCHD